MKRFLIVTAAFILAFAASTALFADDAQERYAQGEAIAALKIDAADGARITGVAARDAAERAAAATGCRVKAIDMHTTRLLGSVIAVIASDTLTTEEIIERLRSYPGTIDAQPNMLLGVEKVPNDPYYDGGSYPLWGLKAIGAPDAWDHTTGADDIYVAVIDTGLKSHPDIDANVDWSRARDHSPGSMKSDPGISMTDGRGHGTHVAGTIGAVGNNSEGIVGVTWNSKIIPIKVFNDAGESYTTNSISAISYITEELKKASPIKIAAVNMSLGGYVAKIPEDYEKALYKDRLEGYALRLLSQVARAPIVAASAGNDGLEHGVPSFGVQESYDSNADDIQEDEMHYPSSLSQTIPNVISVGSVGQNGDGTFHGSNFSNWSSKYVDIAAPGEVIYSLLNDGSGYTRKQGTSMAAPHVAGAAALVAAKLDDAGIEWNGKCIKDILLATTSKDITQVNEWASGKSIPLKKSDNYNVSREGLLRVDNAMAYIDDLLKVSSVDLDPSSCDLIVGGSVLVTANIAPAKAKDKSLTWSADPSDAVEITVNIDGKSATIKALKSGDVTIKATAKDGSGKSASMTIKIKDSDHVHDYDTSAYEFDGTSHWHKCKDCDARSDEAPHESDVWITDASTHKKECKVCGQEFASGSHAAAIGAQWKSDATDHYKLCDTCGEHIEKSPHAEDPTPIEKDADDHAYECGTCGREVRTEQHAWDSKYRWNAAEHWDVCTACGYVTPGTPHDISAGYKDDEHKHWHECADPKCDSGRLNEDDHHSDASGKCVECRRQLTTPSAPHSHKWSSTFLHDTSAHWRYCTSGCGTSSPRASHLMQWYVDAQKHEYRCIVCGYKERSSEHDFSRVSHNALDHWQECAVCGRVGQISSHTFANGRCTAAGCGYADPTYVQRPTITISFMTGKVWRGKGAMTFSLAHFVDMLLDILIDGRSIKGFYTCAGTYGYRAIRAASDETEASTIVTLDEELLRSLADGEHKITFLFADGTSDATFTTYGSTQTGGEGDNGNDGNNGSGGGSGGGCAAGAATITAAALAFVYRRKK